MKKNKVSGCLSVLLAVCLFLTLTACGGEQPAQESGEWTRTGYFTDENDNYLSVTWMDLDDGAGWFVAFAPGEESWGNFLQQEGASLRGNIIPEYEQGEVIVTISEEGEDGLLLAVEGGESYHFKPMEMPEPVATLRVNTEGYGFFRCVDENGVPETGELPSSSLQTGLAEPKTFVLTAEAGEGWYFAKWTLNGEEYSTDEQITLAVTEDADLIAVFESASSDDGQNPVMNFVGWYSSARPIVFVECEGDDGARFTVTWSGSAWESSEWTMSGVFDEETLSVSYANARRTDRAFGEDGEIVSEKLVYENGSGSFRFSEGDTLRWEDETEHMADDIVFTLDPALWTQEYTAAYETVTAMDADAIESFCTAVRAAYLEEDWDELAPLLRYPISIAGTELANAEAFLAFMADKTVDASDRAVMESESCSEMFVNGQGICMGSGQVWLIDPNYMTDAEPSLEIIALSGIVGK